MARKSEPLHPLQAQACECPPPQLVDEDTCTTCGKLLPDDPALQLAAAIGGTYPPPAQHPRVRA